MHDTPSAHIVAILACAIAGLACIYLLVMRLADNVLEALNDMTHESQYQARCSTAPDVSGRQALAIVGVALLLGAVAVLAGTLMGQEFIEYLARALEARAQVH
jgi:hypothetical protein